ncbi:M23 family metallopeptidase [Anianabacter salinae]|uniref:M23 family metallopeptidase n=1 Tax=Anianabacter salinae TaxID=2851023 RepID=UPI00225E1082|nr:M23 family metallopeptidase [Anianabacter salinae]MBV0911689.1 peptidoglycan DD-metalloendopeptidase family protein [Anianabacter salinae]
MFGPIRRFSTALERRFPEQRVFLRSDTETRFIRLSPATQAIGWIGTTLFVGWAIVATAILLMDSIGSGSLRDQAERERDLYEQRLNSLSTERDARAEEARAAQDRFSKALAQVSDMQSMLLASEERLRELETGIEVIQTTLRRAMRERDDARGRAETLEARIENSGDTLGHAEAQLADATVTVDFLTAALSGTAVERDQLAMMAQEARSTVDDMRFERELIEERNDRIFEQLEDAVTVSVEPLDKMFRAAGMNTDDIIKTVRQGYSGQGGPLTPITFSTKGETPDADSVRANQILERLDRMNMYRMAAELLPFDIPIRDSFRYTSGFGPRWGRMHNGTDFAGSHGTAIYATADGVVSFAGRQSGYGNLVEIQHEFGTETRYAHMSRIRVSEGQRVSKGDRIGDMGNTGRSTGTHLHYEVRVNGKPVNPMTYIKAGSNVF